MLAAKKHPIISCSSLWISDDSLSRPAIWKGKKKRKWCQVANLLLFLVSKFLHFVLVFSCFLCVQICSGIKDFVESKVTLLMLFLNAKKWAYVYVYIYCLRSWNILSPSNKGPSFLGYYSVAIWGNTSSISNTGTKFLSILRRYISWSFSFPYFLCLD